MEGLAIILGAAFVFGLPAAVIYLLISHSGLKRKVGELERALLALRETVPPASARPAPPKPPEPKAPPKQATPIPAQPAAHHGKELKPVYGTTEKTPEPPAPASPPPSTPPSGPPTAYVFRQEKVEEFLRWMGANWFYAVAAVSLALAGIFFVQYGIEKGILTPPMRVAAAVLFGLALIGGGEFIRRRFGDGADSHTEYLPSILAGAGLVTLFGAVLAARGMYGLIGANPAFFWLVVVAALAVVLGWFYGPVLAIVGVLGATVAPFLVGGDSSIAWTLYYYFALIAVAGLAIDTFKRWAWLSSLSILFTFLAASLTYLGKTDAVNYVAFALIVTAASVIIPERNLWPRHGGVRLFRPVVEFFTSSKVTEWPEFPARLVGGTVIPTLVVCLLIAIEGPGEYWLAITVLSLLILATVFWFEDAPALESLILLPPIVLLYEIAAEGVFRGEVHYLFRQGISRAPETLWPLDASKLLAIACVAAVVLALKSWKHTPLTVLWAASAAILAPAATIALELFWAPADVMGVAAWSFHVIAVAVLMTLMAERFARREGPSLAVALFVLGALTTICLALVLLLTKTALTLALGVMVVVASWLDKRFDLKPLTWFVQLGGVIAAYRLILDPGIFWAVDIAPLWEMSLNFLGTIGLFALAWKFLQERNRLGAIVVMESSVWTLSGLFFTLLVFRLIEDISTSDTEFSHWAFGLYATVWMLSCGNQLWRLRVGGPLKVLRLILAILTGGLAVLFLFIALTLANPLFDGYEPIYGIIAVNTLLVAYGLPALVFAVGAMKLTHLPRWLAKTFAIAASFLGVVYIGLAIRHAWHGPYLRGPVFDGEQYSYTIAMLLGVVALLFLAIQRRSTGLRRLAIYGLAPLAILKVFFIDMAGLAGLIRVFSFLALGFVLIGLHWLDRLVAARFEEDGPADPEAPEKPNPNKPDPDPPPEAET